MLPLQPPAMLPRLHLPCQLLSFLQENEAQTHHNAAKGSEWGSKVYVYVDTSTSDSQILLAR